MFPRFLRVVCVYTTALLAIGCSSGPRTRGESSSGEVVSQESVIQRARQSNTPDAKEYAAIDFEYRQKNHEGVVKRAKIFARGNPTSPYLDQVSNLQGLSQIALKQLPDAVESFRKAIDAAQNPTLLGMATYNMGYAQYELGRIEEAARTLESVRSSHLERSDRVKLFILRAKVNRVKQAYGTAAQDMLSALASVPESQPRGAVEPMLSFLGEVIEKVETIVVLERLYSDFGDVLGADRVLYRIAQYYFGTGDREKARNALEKLLSRHSDSIHYASAKDRLRKLDFQSVADPRRIGVLLTLSGKFGKFGYRALQGIELALKIFQPQSQSGGSAITMVVMDDRGEPDRATAALEELFYKHQVSAVIGPLVSKLADPVGKKAQELGLPLITLTQKEALAGDYVFNASLTPAIQIKELVRYAVEKAGIKSFAILAPSSKFGEEYAKVFWDEVEKRSGVVRGYEQYPAEETDFRVYIDRLVGLANPDARSRELEELNLLKAATPIKVKSKKFDRMFELKPIVDFQAVFIPDEPKVLGQILPTFAYRDVEKVLFLGTNTWNSTELIARAGTFAEGSVFVDGFFPNSSSSSTKGFIADYRDTFQIEPTTVEALSYDAAQILAHALRSGPVQTRADVKDRIAGLRDFQGVSGKISYQAGKIHKRLSLLTIRGGKVEEIAFQ